MLITHLTLDFLRETCEDKAVETMQPWSCELKTNDAHRTSHIRFFLRETCEDKAVETVQP
ncbi:hypothetical protein Hs30E_08250 [Lactococcus hodotermopsidis]|uniref:Uncharacterized protein n=1 Tax=Pseudolactococcus hodotermopsidis TaxID=2709157 RepID=A0A6A0BCW1_9LACT|nr:hypothetical protein [Lactococcus hodotermopsidis]GFH42274.1 hypothetical protein Hs30E_08250 [Lactococcus hodotermopsidis]